MVVSCCRALHACCDLSREGILCGTDEARFDGVSVRFVPEAAMACAGDYFLREQRTRAVTALLIQKDLAFGSAVPVSVRTEL